ncbi:MAG: GIY-YIG nuclease family protein [Xanthobacteraceae bacterium]|nr:GIY-YIG nuclease family protein [Xanthobacteraceae bacterium]
MEYAVYILASKRHGTLYIGVTNDLSRRLSEHSLGKGSKFVRDYKVNRLVHVELFDDPESAITREKQLKKWNRDWEINLIERENPDWQDRTPDLT